MDRRLPRRFPGPPRVYHRGVGRPLPDLAARPLQEDRGRPGRRQRAAGRRRARAAGRRPRPGPGGRLAPPARGRPEGPGGPGRAHPGGARPPARRGDVALPRPPGRPDLRAHAGRGRRARAGPLRRLVRDVPPLGLHRARAARDLQGRRGAAPLRRLDGLRRPRTCPRSTRSAGASARARTIPWMPAPTTPAAPGPSARSAAGTRPSTPTSARSRTSTASSPRPASWASRSRSTSPSRPRPTTRMSASIREWFRHRPGRHDQVRREPAQEVPGHLSDRLRIRGLAGPLGRAARRLPLLGRPGRQDLPRGQPAHQALPLLGLGHRRGPRPASRRRSSSPRRSPGPR